MICNNMEIAEQDAELLLRLNDHVPGNISVDMFIGPVYGRFTVTSFADGTSNVFVAVGTVILSSAVVPTDSISVSDDMIKVNGVEYYYDEIRRRPL